MWKLEEGKIAEGYLLLAEQQMAEGHCCHEKERWYVIRNVY